MKLVIEGKKKDGIKVQSSLQRKKARKKNDVQ